MFLTFDVKYCPAVVEKMGGQKREREKRRKLIKPQYSNCNIESTQHTIRLGDICKINEDGTATITMPTAPPGYYIDPNEIINQLIEIGILNSIENVTF